jgi:choline dehydrogenase
LNLAETILEQAPFKQLGAWLLQKHQSDEARDQWVRERSESAYHPCGTCRMGAPDEAVVGLSGEVHGLRAVRVVDASIMPEITNGNLNAVVIMMAEKIADGMKQIAARS